jgi:hypothetical protein
VSSDVVRTWGSLPAERLASYPCDALLAEPDDVLFRAVDVAATPAVVFRWLCQLKIAPYSYDWIDNWGRRSPRRLTEGVERLAVGQAFMRIFTLAGYHTDRHLTLSMTDPAAGRRFGRVALTYAVAPAGEGRSRLVVKLLVKRPDRFPGAWLAPLLPAGDLVMMRKQLLTLKHLAEGGR